MHAGGKIWAFLLAIFTKAFDKVSTDEPRTIHPLLGSSEKNAYYSKKFKSLSLQCTFDKVKELPKESLSINNDKTLIMRIYC